MPGSSLLKFAPLVLLLANLTPAAGQDPSNHAAIYLDFESGGAYSAALLTDVLEADADSLVIAAEKALGCTFNAPDEDRLHSATCQPAARTGALLYRKQIDLRPLAAELSRRGIAQGDVWLSFPGLLTAADVELPPDFTTETYGLPYEFSSILSFPTVSAPDPFYIQYGYDYGYAVPGTVAILGLLGLAVFFARRFDRRSRLPTGENQPLPWFEFMRIHLRLAVAAWIVLLPLAGFRAGTVANLMELPGWLEIGLMFLFWSVPAAAVEAVYLVLSRDAITRLRSVQTSRWDYVRQCFWSYCALMLPLIMFVMAMETLADSAYRMSAMLLLAAAVTLLLASAKSMKARGLVLESLTSGELRDRAFELAAKAKVRLRQVFLIPANQMPSVNAFAALGNIVILTEDLVGNLSRRELDTILAHEIAHLKGRHPLLHVAATVVPPLVLTIACLVSPFAVLNEYVVWIALPMGFATTLLLFRWIEKVADTGGVKLTGDPEATVTALARLHRLNSLPAHWSGVDAKLFSHPSLSARAGDIARRFELPVERVNELLQLSSPEPDHYEIPSNTHARVFSTSFKQSFLMRSAWSRIGMALTPLAIVSLAVERGAGPRWLLFALGLAAAIALYTLAGGCLGHRSMQKLSSPLRSALAETGGQIVGIAPSAEPRIYEHFYIWDMGILRLEEDRLIYRGEQTEFTLAASDISVIEEATPMPQTGAPSSTTVRWASEPPGGAFRIDYLAGASLRHPSLYATEFRQQLLDWHDAHRRTAATGSKPVPDFGEVTSFPPKTLNSPGAILQSVLFVGIAGVGLSALLGFPAEPYLPLGACGVALWPHLRVAFYRERTPARLSPQPE